MVHARCRVGGEGGVLDGVPTRSKWGGLEGRDGLQGGGAALVGEPPGPPGLASKVWGP